MLEKPGFFGLVENGARYELRNSQFGGGFINAETVNAQRIGGDIWNFFQGQQETISGRQMSRQEYRNRQALLDKVRDYWVKGVLEKSLYDQTLIKLGLEERSHMIACPWNMVLETSNEKQNLLPQGTKVIDLFDQIGEGRTLLILGEPGSGKTTTLLEPTFRTPTVTIVKLLREKSQTSIKIDI